MKQVRILIILCALLQTVFFAGAQSREAAVNKTYTHTVDGIERSYIMHLPEGLPPDAPLVFVLHGYTGRANPAEYDMDAVADRHGFAVCYPQGIKDTRGNTCWNVGYPFQQDMTVDDVRFLCELAGHVQQKFHLSPENTFCTGISNGGEMCYLLAYRRPDVFAAVAPVAGLTLLSMYRQYECPQAIPLFEIHGTEDRISEWTGDLKDEGGWGAYLPVPVAVNYWVAKNRCTRELTDTLPGKTPENGHYVIAHKYVDGTGGNQVWLYEIVGGSHAWGREDLDTGEEIWKFFSQVVKNKKEGLASL